MEKRSYCDVLGPPILVVAKVTRDDVLVRRTDLSLLRYVKIELISNPPPPRNYRKWCFMAMPCLAPLPRGLQVFNPRVGQQAP